MKAERTSRSSGGFTILEMMFSLVIIAVLISSTFSITVETISFMGTVDADSLLQSEADTAFDRLAEGLRKCGWSTLAGVNYPRVTGGGKVLEFRVLQDIDGNGYPFDAATGDLEYSAKVFRIARDGAGNLRITDGNAIVWHLARHVDDAVFETYAENPALQYRELRVVLTFRTQDRKGDAIALTRSECIQMRN
jgi:prepilin-type N-terminal cleavage/methylation domain-containing protein